MSRSRRREVPYISDFHKLPNLDEYVFKPPVINQSPVIIQEKVSVSPKVTASNIENNFYNLLIKNGEILSLGEIQIVFWENHYYYYDPIKKEINKFNTEDHAFKYALLLFKT